MVKSDRHGEVPIFLTERGSTPDHTPSRKWIRFNNKRVQQDRGQRIHAFKLPNEIKYEIDTDKISSATKILEAFINTENDSALITTNAPK